MMDRAKELLQELIDILDIEEESDSGTLFHPAYISCCRVLLNKKIGDWFDNVREVLDDKS